MKRFILGILFSIFCAASSMAASIVVDKACPTNGNGTGGYTATCDGTASGNPSNDLQGRLSGTLAAGDTVDIRGVHAAHDSCPGSTTGTYDSDRFRIVAKAGSSGNPIIIQSYNYGTVNEEVVHITGATARTWTQCATCDLGDDVACRDVAGLPSSCTEYWFVRNGRSLACVKTDGTPCYKLPVVTGNTSKADMTNAHSNYVATFCANYPWIKCNTSSDCPDHLSCGGNSLEVDSVSECTGAPCAEFSGGYMVARWKAETPGPVINDNNGQIFDVCNSQWITIRGLSLRNNRRAMVSVVNTGDGGCSGTSDNIVVTDNILAYSHDIGGSDYGLYFFQTPTVTVTNNYFAYIGSENIHTQTASGGSYMVIRGNVIRDTGDWNVLGTRGGVETNFGPRTPECMTIGGGFNDYELGGNTSDISNNLLLRCRKQGVLLEGAANLNVHDNVIIGIGRAGIKISPEANTQVNVDIWNNVVVDSCVYSGDSGIWLDEDSTGSIDDINIYNNTVASDNASCEGIEALNNSITNVVIRNNIFSDLGTNQKQVNITEDGAGMLYEHNLVQSGAGTVVTWGASGYTCANVNSGNMPGTDNNLCANPLFSNTTVNNFHLARSSPAVNAGTSTGMPAGRTTSICNTVAAPFSIPKYSDCIRQQGSAWDIGAVEFRRAFILTDFEWRTPEPDYSLASYETGN